MKWEKKGLIFVPNSNFDWMMSHAQVPLADKISDEVLRIYFGTRDKMNRTVTTYIEVEADNPHNILYVHTKPVIGLGKFGCFDDSGAMPSWMVDYKGLKYLYYTGWNVGTTVPYRNSIGLAASKDNGQTFYRVYAGPIMDRTYLEPYFCGIPCVLREGRKWRMWYLSCVKWDIYKDKPEPFYHIKYAESTNGTSWNRKQIVCIDFKSPEEAGIVRPTIIKTNGLYRMWYSYRDFQDYREKREHSYRIGYAESHDGIKWKRKDEIVGIEASPDGWDSDMIAYPYVYEHKNNIYMLYNGNQFGKSGFGYAVLN